jgi:hypothetical protein
MSFTAAEVIDEARDYHLSFDDHRHPGKVCLRALSRLVRRITGQVTDLSEETLAIPYEIDNATLQAAVAAAIAAPGEDEDSGNTGISLPSHYMVLGNPSTWKADSDAKYRVELVDYTSEMDRGLTAFPAVMIYGSKLWPINLKTVVGYRSNLTGWEDYLGLKLTLVRVPADMTTQADVVALPDIAKDSLVSMLAHWMAGRGGREVLADLPSLPAEAQSAEARAVQLLAGMDSTSTWTVVRK